MTVATKQQPSQYIFIAMTDPQEPSSPNLERESRLNPAPSTEPQATPQATGSAHPEVPPEPPNINSTATDERMLECMERHWMNAGMQGMDLLEDYRAYVTENALRELRPDTVNWMRDYLLSNGIPLRHGPGAPRLNALIELLTHTPEQAQPRRSGRMQAIQSNAQVSEPRPSVDQHNLNRERPIPISASPLVTPARPLRPMPRANAAGPPAQPIFYPPPIAQPQFQPEPPRSNVAGPSTQPIYYPPPGMQPQFQQGPIYPNSPQIYKPSNTKDPLKMCSRPSAKHGGGLQESLPMFEKEFILHCSSLMITKEEALTNVYVVFKGAALDYYLKHVRPTATSPDQVFQMMTSRLHSRDRAQRALSLWNSLTLGDFRAQDRADREALDKLVEKAMDLQTQLEERHQNDSFLRDMLMRATNGEPFARLLLLSPPTTSTELIERLNMILESKLQPAIIPTQSAINHTDGNHPPTPAHADELYGQRRGLFDRRYGQRYGQGRAQRRGNWSSRRNQPFDRSGANAAPGRIDSGANRAPRRSLSPVDPKTGRGMTCRACGSIFHFIRDCNRGSPARVAYHVASILTQDNPGSYDVDEILNELQEISDDLWSASLDESVDEEQEEQPPDEAEAREELHSSLASSSVAHTIHHSNVRAIDLAKRGQQFLGVCMDHGAENTVAGLNQYLEYCKFANTEVNLKPSDHWLKFGNSYELSKGIGLIRFPLTDANYFEYETDVVDLDIPILFGLDSMKRYGLKVDELEDIIAHPATGMKIPLAHTSGHLWRMWDIGEVLCSRRDLLKLHRRFAHPSVDKLYNLLRRAKPEEVDQNTRKILNDITERCGPCQRLAPKPYVFQISMPDLMQFNHEIIVDVFFIDGKPVLHVVDRGTHFSASEFLQGQSAEAIWNALINCWVSVYVGFPNVLSHDQGSAFTAKLFQDACKHFGIFAKGAPVEAHNALSVGERCHGPLRRIYNKIKLQCPTLERSLLLSIAVKALNDGRP